MLHARGDLVKALPTSAITTVVVLVVEHQIWPMEVHGDLRAPRDRGPCSRCGSRRHLPSGMAVGNFLPVASALGAFVPRSKLVHTAVLSGT